MNITFCKCLLLASIFLFSSCKDNSGKNDELFKSMNESLEASNLALSTHSGEIARELEKKSMKPETKERADIWLPRLNEVYRISKTAFDQVELIKHNVLNGHKITSVTANDLFDKLLGAKSKLFSINAGMSEAFQNTQVVTNRSLDSSRNATDFYNTFFKNISNAGILTVLSKLQNNIRLMQIRMGTYCNVQVWSEGLVFDSYTVIVGQNTTSIKPGETLEIKAGVGAFTKQAKPEVAIYGNSIPLEPEGYASYSFKASSKPGKKYLPVDISYTDILMNKRITKRVIVEYTIEEK